MPKRKHREEDNIAKKLRCIEKMLKECKSRRRRIVSSSSDSEGSLQSLHNPDGRESRSPRRNSMDMDSMFLPYDKHQQETFSTSLSQPLPLEPSVLPPTVPQAQLTPSTLTQPPPVLAQSTSHGAHEEQSEDHATQSLPEDPGIDNDILEILGDDPTEKIEYGKDIRPELAARFNHIVTNGMNKDYRKEICDKYLIPGNCTLIGAPVLNPEVKVALNDTTLKRDKLIEARQKRVATAISCIGEAISHALEAKEKNNVQIKLLMDSARLMCDAQHNDSVSRRNLAVYPLKKEMKEPLLNTKIDKFLFGENLTDSLKAVKAVTKSGTELKTQFKPPAKNWRTPVAGRRPPATGRRGVPAAPMASAQTAAPPAPPITVPHNTRAHSSRKPPPPPQRSARRRY